MVIGVGCDAERAPTHRASDDEFGCGVYGCHKDGLPTLKRRLAPLVGVASVTTGNAGDRKRKGQGDVSGIAIGSETDFAAREAIHPLQGRVSARFPRFPDSKRGLPFIHVARAFHAEATVFFVATVSAIAANDAVQAGTDCGNGILRFAENPDLNHVAGFPVVGGGSKARRNDHTSMILVENEAVDHREPFSIRIERARVCSK